ncbi:MAG: hypothetical protein AAFQ82_06655, partial [Myxococcota bacterium]
GAITGRITPDIGPPVVAPLLQILRGDGRVNELIGQSHHTMANPSGSGPDWLILSTVTYDQVYVFSGTDGGLLQDAGTLSPSVSVTDNAFGIALCSNFNAASGQVDLFVTDTNPAQAAGDPARAFFFEFDGTSLVERSVVTGRNAFGRNCAGVGSYVSTTESAFVISATAEGAGILVR